MRVASLVATCTPDAGRSASRARAAHRSSPRRRGPTQLSASGRPAGVDSRLRGNDAVLITLRMVVVALAMLLCAAATPLRASETIAAIQITGNRTVDADAIRSRLKVTQ